MYGNGSPPTSSSSASSKLTGGSMSSRSKRTKKTSWGARERAGMSFLIVIAFFAIFGLIILTEVLMIDDRGRGGGVIVRHGSSGGRFGESVPDYDDVKDDYLDDTGIFVRETKYGSAQVKNIMKNQKGMKAREHLSSKGEKLRKREEIITGNISLSRGRTTPRSGYSSVRTSTTGRECWVGRWNRSSASFREEY